MPTHKITLDDVLSAVNDGFTQTERRLDRIDGRLDRIEKIVDHWPPPSQVRDLLALAGNLKRRVEALEKRVGIKTN